MTGILRASENQGGRIRPPTADLLLLVLVAALLLGDEESAAHLLRLLPALVGI